MSSKRVENLYYKLNKKIKKNYSFLDQEFKDVKNLFELQFRLIELNRKKAVNTNLKKITKKNFFHKSFYRIIIIISSNLFNFFNITPRIFMRSKSMSKFAEKNLKIALNYKCQNAEKLTRLVKSNIFINEINAAFKIDKNFISRALKNFCIHGVLLHTDQTPSAYTLIQAAKEKNIKTAVLAHGTLTDPCLASVLPLHAKKIFVWTKKTEKYINFCNKSPVAKFASGIKMGIIQKKKANSVLIAGDPYNFINENLERRFENFIQKLQKIVNPLRLLYCPHPTDRNEIIKKKNT